MECTLILSAAIKFTSLGCKFQSIVESIMSAANTTDKINALFIINGAQEYILSESLHL